MNKFKKYSLVMLFSIGIITLICACDSKTDSLRDNTQNSEIDISDNLNQEPGNAQRSVADKSELISILDKINRELNLASAGESLKAIELSSMLLDWGANSNMSEDEIKDTITSFINNLDEDSKAEFNKKLLYIGNTYASLLRDGAKNLLSMVEAKYKPQSYPWPDKSAQVIESLVRSAQIS